jgi:hypothetical protein
MRPLPRLLAGAALAGLAGTALVGAAAPAAASHQCSGTLCLVTDPFTIPAGTPVVSPVGAGPSSVPGPLLCDTTTGECTQTYVLLPGAVVSSDGTTLTTVTIPAYGIGIGPDGSLTVFYGAPPLPPLDFSVHNLDLDVVVVAPLSPLVLGNEDPRCALAGPGTDGPVRVRVTPSCQLVVTVDL